MRVSPIITTEIINLLIYLIIYMIKTDIISYYLLLKSIENL